MQASRLREWITIKVKSVSGQDSYGQDVITETDVGPMRAEVLSIAGSREFASSAQRFADANYRVTIRYTSSDIDREDRVLWGERTLDILDVADPDGKRRSLQLICRELVE